MKCKNLAVFLNEEKRQGKEAEGRKNNNDTKTVLTKQQFSQSGGIDSLQTKLRFMVQTRDNFL